MTDGLDCSARIYRDRLTSDLTRPAYHFAIPDGNGVPGDANGAFWADGRYHLMYLYRNETTKAFHWGHISSIDLLHWRSHPDALTIHEGDEGCFSGGAFVDDDRRAYLTFWKFPAKDPRGDNGGIAIAWADPPYDVWTRLKPIAIEGERDPWGVVNLEVNGEKCHIGCADPSNIWKKDGWYYLETGNLCVLNAYGRKEEDPACYKGDWVDLFRSRDLKSWQYVHRFYTNPHTDPTWPDLSEDDMCPSFLPLPDKKSGGVLTDKYLQLFIAHNKGAQYYVGRLEGETFVPETHGRFSWVDNTFFAPEALIDGKNRQIMWSWLLDNREKEYERFGWTGVYGAPRALWWDDGELHMAPAEELDTLEYARRSFAVGTAESCPLPFKYGMCARIRACVDMENATQAGFSVREDAERGERTEIYYDKNTASLVMDTTLSGPEGRCVCERAPLTLKEGEKLQLDILIDHSVVEVYANERQAICRRVYPTDILAATGLRAFSDGANFGKVTVCAMAETNFA